MWSATQIAGQPLAITPHTLWFPIRRDSRCECQFWPTFWLSEPFFLADWFWWAVNWNRSRYRYRKGSAFHPRSRPCQMISRHRPGLNAISPSSLKVHADRSFKSTDAPTTQWCTGGPLASHPRDVVADFAIARVVALGASIALRY